MDSIIQTKKECYLCGSNLYGMDALEEHHIFSGTSNRKQSEKYGLKVWLCGYTCHRYGKNAAHVNRETNLRLKRVAQEAFEKKHGTREDFIKEFGKSFL